MSFLDIPASHGRLEGFEWEVENPRGQALVCHPHPKHGGTMHNHVTYRMANAFRQAGVNSLRFNFRGVGRSTGSYDEGRGEVDDGKGAFNFLHARAPQLPHYIAGFSFGSRVALRIALEDARVERVLAVGMALELYDFSFAQTLEKKAAFIHADQDEYASLETVKSFVSKLPGEKRLFVVENSDHLCSGRLDAFAEQAEAAVEWLLRDG
jgi:alpha/beta superfamily hydrolase